MNWEFSSIILLLAISGLLTSWLTIFSWKQRRRGVWALSFAVLTLTASIWSFGYALELSTATLASKLFWAKVEYIGIVTTPVAWFLFAMQYTARAKWITRTWYAILMIFPLTTLLLVFTNEVHGQIWQTTELTQSGLFLLLDATYGTWFWIHSIFSYTLMLGGTIALVLAFARFGSAYRWQNGILLVGALTPWVGNALFISGLNPISGIDLAPFGFGITSLLLAAAIFRVNLFDIVPIARRVAVDNMSDVLIVLDLQQRIVDINPAGQRLFGKGLKAFVGQPITTLPLGTPDFISSLGHRAQTNSEVTLFWRELEQHYDIQTSALYGRDKQLDGHLVILRDITLRKLAEEELASRNHILETLSSLSEEITGTLELQAVLDTAVKSTVELLAVTSAYVNRWDEERSTLTAIAEWFGPEAADKELLSDIGVPYKTAPFGRSEDWMLDPDGEYVVHVDDPDISDEKRSHMVQFGGQTVFEIPLIVKGRAIGTLELWESRRKREYSRSESSLILAIARQIALAMDNALLYEQALAASQLKSRLLSQVNHELRTPLSVIMLYSGMLADGVYGELSGKQQDINGRVVKNTEYLSTLITQFLDQAELENGQTTLKRESFNPEAIVDQVHLRLNTLAETKGLRFTTSCPDSVPNKMSGDTVRLQQIMVNLVSNAIKYTDEGIISLCLQRPDDAHWMIQVADTGCGIPAEAQQIIFEPFRQVDETASTIIDGAGLGLSIVKQLVEMMSGEIAIESQVGVGSTFSITLPIIETDKEAT